MPKLVVIFISGFRQGLHRPTGIELMYDDAKDLYNDIQGAEVLRPFQWSMDWPAIASFLARHITGGHHEDRTRIIVAAYSWGAGWGFQRLSRKLHSLGVLIDIAVLIDPIYRSPLLPTWFPLNILSMSLFGSIKIRENVREVFHFRQFVNRPRGRACVAIDPYATKVHPAIELDCRHQLADVHPRVSQLFETQLEQLAASVGIHKAKEAPL